MKNKWLIVLFMFFLGVILLSLWITQQSQKAVSSSEKKNPLTERSESGILPVYPPPASLTPIAGLPSAKSGIIMIKAPASEPEKSISVSKIADKATNNISSQNVASSAEAKDLPQAGINKIRKLPSSKETQEMNSNGIVMY